MKSKLSFLVLLLALFGGCKEEFIPETNDFQSALIVEGNITDKLEIQTIQLSLTSDLEDRDLKVETGATVMIEADNGEEYTFSQGENGMYNSTIAFAAQPNVAYKLYVRRSNGQVYNSYEIRLPEEADLLDVYAERIIKDGIEGIQVYADSKGNNEAGSYFRYKYEEAYEVVTPNFSNSTASLRNVNADGSEFEVEIIPRESDIGRICYSLEYSKGINQITTSNLSENIIEAVPIRFIPSSDPIISDQYSIEVTQFVETPEAYNFYKILNDLSNSESILSPNQPGKIQGNIYNIENPEELVVGYFNAVLKDSKRIFFNYRDFDLQKPPYFFECEKLTLDYDDNLGASQDGDENERLALYQALSTGAFQFVSQEDNAEGIYTIIRIECADCTSFSSTTRPEFWID